MPLVIRLPPLLGGGRRATKEAAAGLAAAVPGTRASSADGGSPQSAGSDDVHKKSAHRPRRTPPGSPRRPPPPPPLTPPSQDDGEPLYRKSSARTFRTGKYVPPALRGKGSLPVLDDFEEVGEPVVAEWRSRRACGGARPSRASAVWRGVLDLATVAAMASPRPRESYVVVARPSPRRDAVVPPSSTRERRRRGSTTPNATQARAARTRTPSTRARPFTECMTVIRETTSPKSARGNCTRASRPLMETRRRRCGRPFSG